MCEKGIEDLDRRNDKRYRYGGDGIGKALLQVLGLPPSTTRFELHVGVNEVVTVHCEYNLKYSDNDVGELVKTIAGLKMDFSDSFHDVTSLSDEARRFQQHDALSALQSIARGDWSDASSNVVQEFAKTSIEKIKAKQRSAEPDHPPYPGGTGSGI